MLGALGGATIAIAMDKIPAELYVRLLANVSPADRTSRPLRAIARKRQPSRPHQPPSTCDCSQTSDKPTAPAALYVRLLANVGQASRL